MTPEKIEQERQTFEAWISKPAPRVPIDPCQKQKDGCYTYDHIDFAWQTWQARAAQSEWISVEDRLPENNVYVLAVTSRGLVISDRVCDYGIGKEWVSGHSDNPITHWQPLPAPPTTNPAA